MQMQGTQVNLYLAFLDFPSLVANVMMPQNVMFNHWVMTLVNSVDFIRGV
jgi:hypothetical protein